MINAGVKHLFLSKKEFFRFPLNYFFKAYGLIPVYKNVEFINSIVKTLDSNDELHVVISPEGQLAATTQWKKGFYYLAKKANVPIIVGYIDYSKRKVGFKKIIIDVSTLEETMTEISRLYKDIKAKHPENFSIDSKYLDQ